MNRITPRNINFEISKKVKKYWLHNDPDQTAFADALSALLPVGERFFISAVRHYQDNIDDPELREQVNAFIKQEGNHNREHIDYNNGLRTLGYDVDAMEKRASINLEKNRNPRVKLAVTCGLEHFTSIFSYQILKHPFYLDGVPPVYRELWQWHALEELEHKSVPFDLYLYATREMSAFTRYIFRITVMINLTFGFVIEVYRNIKDIFHSDGRKISLNTWIRWTWKIIVKPGFFRRSFISYLRYYLPGYHPDDFTDHRLMEMWRKTYQLSSTN